MKVLLDLNVLIDVPCRWREFPDSFRLYRRLATETEHEGAFAACGYTTLYYVLNKIVSETRVREILVRYREKLTMVPFTRRMAESAHLLPLRDLEDACIAATAYESRCDVIGTRNKDDFAGSPIPARTPGEILADLGTTQK